MNLALSLIALVAGPLLYRACQSKTILRSALDGLLFVTISGIVIIHILPEVYSEAGFVAIVILAGGAGFAFLAERWPVNGDRTAYSWAIVLAAIGLALHAAMDGLALIPSDHLNLGHVHGHDHDARGSDSVVASLSNNQLALGVILHRIPIGMAIWWTVRPQLGRAAAIGTLTIIALATTVTYTLSDPLINLLESTQIAYFQAFVAGTLMHVIVFSSVRSPDILAMANREQLVMGERLGIVAGLLILYLLPSVH